MKSIAWKIAAYFIQKTQKRNNNKKELKYPRAMKQPTQLVMCLCSCAK